MTKTPPMRPESLAAQAMGWIDPATGALVPPIHPATTFLRSASYAVSGERIYTRADNPSYDAPEALLTRLEGGAESLLFASGMAAATALFLALAPGDHVLAPQVMYWSLRDWLLGAARDWGLNVELVDMTDIAAISAALRPGETKLIWIETPSNPLWEVTDIAALAALAHQVGARLAVDSTTATPVLSRPLAYGADIVMHSATKYLNGHSDVLAGSLTCADPADPLWQRVRKVRAQIGGVLGSFESWLLLRGMRTVFLRVRAMSASALRVAEHFHDHPKIAAVLYPGLPSDPGHAIAARQMQGGFGGMLSVRVAAGRAAALAVADRVHIWKRATSLGGVESLIEHRASVEGPASPVPGDLLRLSVGLEAVEDLIEDLDQALATQG